MVEMRDALQQFVSAHPEFFEKKGAYLVLRSDIHDLVERYARLVDADEYERIRAIVDSIRKENSEHLENSIRECNDEIQKFKAQLPEIKGSIQNYEDEIREVESDLAELKLEEEELLKEYTPWYFSSLVFWLLALSGVVFTYVGVFITVSAASTFLPLGMMCLLGGVVLQNRNTPRRRSGSFRVDAIKRDRERLQAKRRLLKLKRATHLQQKSIATEAINKLQLSVRSNEQKINLLNG